MNQHTDDEAVSATRRDAANGAFPATMTRAERDLVLEAFHRYPSARRVTFGHRADDPPGPGPTEIVYRDRNADEKQRHPSFGRAVRADRAKAGR